MTAIRELMEKMENVSNIILRHYCLTRHPDDPSESDKVWPG